MRDEDSSSGKELPIPKYFYRTNRNKHISFGIPPFNQYRNSRRFLMKIETRFTLWALGFILMAFGLRFEKYKVFLLGLCMVLASYQ